jgi:glycosyltransferase involved in cell wall biosynthesis
MTVCIKGMVSIVVASYNYERFLKNRIDGLLAQSYSDIEIIVIDDMSTDNSVSVLNNFASNRKVRVIANNSNSGWVAVSNQGLAESLGEFVMFANCDDIADVDLVKGLVEPLFLQNSIGVSFCRSSMIDENGFRTGTDFSFRSRSFRRYCRESGMIPKQLFQEMLLHSCVIPNLSGVLFRRELLEEIGGFSRRYEICSDWHLYFELSKRTNVFYTSTELNGFRQHNGTIRSSAKSRLMLTETCELMANWAADGKYSSRIKTLQRICDLILIETLDPRRFRFGDLVYFIKLASDQNKVIFLMIPFSLLRIGSTLAKVAFCRLSARQF